MSTAVPMPALEEESAPYLGVARSARGLRWVERLPSQAGATATAIAQRHGVPELLARILAARGATLETAGQLLDPALRTLLPDPSSLQDMDRAAERLAAAITAREPIALFGDYDVDGAASLALMQRFLLAHGHLGRLYVPDRLTEGYGPNAAAFARLIEEGASLIVTLDCGTASGEVIAEATGRGVDVVVVDHHLASEALPEALAVVNPNRLDDLSGQGHLAAAGVTFLLLVATTRVLREQGHYGAAGPEPDLLRWLDLVALATICDVVPLKGVNRAYVSKGLQVLRRRSNLGLRALADAAGLAGEATSYHLGFVLGPRINAGGRLSDAGLGTRLLLSEDEVEAAELAQVLDQLNRERRAREAQMCEEAVAQAERTLEADPDAPLLLCGSEAWHKGVIGLVASRLAERFGRPAIALAWEDGTKGTGSARSVAGVDIGSAVRAAVEEGLLIKGGGHAMAAGLTLARDRAEAFERFISEHVADAVAARRATSELALDGALMPTGITPELMDILDKAGPYGVGNPQPRFALAAHRCQFVKPVGEAHLRCVLAAGDGARLDAIAFRVVGTELGALLQKPGGLPLHFAGHLRRDTWGGRMRIEYVIEDVADPRSQGR